MIEITNEESYSIALESIEKIMDEENPSEQLLDYMEELVKAVEAYEDIHYPMGG